MSFSVDRIRHLYEFPSHYLDCNGHRYHYLDEGQGLPLVMIHGNPSWSFMYRELVRDLRGSYRVIVPDHIGCGLSDKPNNRDYEYHLEQRVNDLEMLLERVGVRENITLIMHDWGGPIGMTYAVRHPSKVAKFVVFNTAAFLLPSGKTLHWTLRFCRGSQVAAFLIRRLNLFSITASYVGCRFRPMPALVRHAYTGPYDSWQHRVATLRFIQDIPLNHSDTSYPILLRTQERLSEFRKFPILICWGEKDFIFDQDFLNEWIRRFPEAELHRFPQGGHYVLEDMAREIVPLVRGFLVRHS